MTPILSGTSTERILRSLLLSLLVDVFAVMFLYDGYVGYAQENAKQFASLLGLQTAAVPSPNSQLSAARGEQIAQVARPGEPIDKIVAEIGPASHRQDGAAYFLGPGGWLQLDSDGNTIRDAKWVAAPHTEADQKFQRWIGWILVVVGFAATINLGRVLATRAQLTDAGLQVTGRPLIPFESMTALRASTSSAEASELAYTHSGDSKTLRLDPYLYKKAGAISQAIAERKGFTFASTR